MSFWSNHEIEPKRKYRWILDIGGIPFWTIKKVDKPSWTISTAEHAFINHKFYFPGRMEYNEVSFTIVDSTSPDAAETLRQIVSASGYRLPEDANTATQSITKQAAVNALGTITIKQITGGGNMNAAANVDNNRQGAYTPGQDSGDIVEAWVLKNAFITSVEFGDLDYTSDDLNEITIKVRYDYAYLNNKDRGLAANSVEVSQRIGGNIAKVDVGEPQERQD